MTTEVFEQRYIPEPNTGCWLWTMARDRDGYGVWTPPGSRKQARVHRLAYALFRGDIPKGRFVLHRCDTPSCVNPDHLFLGDHKVNMRDARDKGRKYVGELNNKARFTEADIREIRRIWANREATQAELAARFGTFQPVISQIVRRKTWAFVE